LERSWVNHTVARDKQSKDLDVFLAGVEGRAFQMARIATRDPEEALDIVQDAMFKLVQRYASKDPSEWGPLFYRILQHRIKDWHRRTWVRSRWRAWFPRKNNETDSDENPIEAVPDARIRDFSDEVEIKNATSELESALHELPLRQRQAFFLRAYEGYNVAETAMTMSCSVGSVKTHYSRAIRALRSRLKDFAP